VTLNKIILILEYQGTRYYGFQLQANVPTIQGELEKAICKLTGERVRVLAASRTDTGVHAKGQVVSFRTGSSLPLETFVSGLNHFLPDDIAVKRAHRANNSFNVRRNATSREYEYHILNSQTRSPIRQDFSYLVSIPLDTEAMNEACQALIGEHDLASFATRTRGKLKSTVRTVHKAEIRKTGDTVIFNMAANSFLPHQIRNTVGTLIRVGTGKMTINEFYSIIKAGKTGMAGPTIPASGLYLMKVNYPRPL